VGARGQSPWFRDCAPHREPAATSCLHHGGWRRSYQLRPHHRFDARLWLSACEWSSQGAALEPESLDRCRHGRRFRTARRAICPRGDVDATRGDHSTWAVHSLEGRPRANGPTRPPALGRSRGVLEDPCKSAFSGTTATANRRWRLQSDHSPNPGTPRDVRPVDAGARRSPSCHGRHHRRLGSTADRPCLSHR